METHQLKLAGLVAGAIIVVGVISVLTFTPAGRLNTIRGTSADVGDVATGNVVVMAKDDYQKILTQLRDYANADETTRSAIIQEVIHSLESWQP